MTIVVALVMANYYLKYIVLDFVLILLILTAYKALLYRRLYTEKINHYQ